MIPTDSLSERPARAKPLTVEERQATIIAAVTPLLLERGRDVTSKELADAAGVAEGTVFRAFGDKETLIQAVLQKLLDPEPFQRGLAAIDPQSPLEDKVRTMVELMQGHFGKVFTIMAKLGERGRPPAGQQRRHFAELIATALEPDAARLSLPPERVAHLLRLIGFSAAFPKLNEGGRFTVEELTELMLYGIAGRSAANHPQSS